MLSLGLAWLLAVVFVVSAVGKLRDQAGTRIATAEFGIPPALSRAVSVGLPVVELAVAALLVLPVTARVGGIAAAALLSAFTVAIVRLIARGESPDCHCFGQISSRPVGWATVARNLALLGVAVVTVGLAQPDTTSPEWFSDIVDGRAPTSLLLAGQAVMLVMMCVGGLVLLKRQTSISGELQALRHAIEDSGVEPARPRHSTPDVHVGLPIGAPAPTFSLPGRDGTHVGLGDLAPSGTPAIIVFVSPSCAPCKVLAPQIAQWERVHGDHLTFVLISKGSAAANETKAIEYVGRHFLECETGGTSKRFGVQWTPAAVAVDASGRIASTIRYGEEAIADLSVDMVSGDLPSPGHDHRPTIGGPLPSTEAVPANELHGSEHLVVLWSETCRYCADMIPDFTAVANDSSSTTNLYFVVDDEAQLAAERFGAATAFDADFSLGRALGATGTPAAVLVDADGMLRSQVATGAEAILALLGIEQRVVAPVPIELRT